MGKLVGDGETTFESLYTKLEAQLEKTRCEVKLSPEEGKKAIKR